MTHPLEFAGLLLAFALLALSVALGARAVRRTREHELPPPPSWPTAFPGAPPAVATPGPRPTRGLWVVTAASAVTGFALVVAVVAGLLLDMLHGNVLTTPPVAGGLLRDDDPSLRTITEQQRRDMRDAGVPHPVIAVYGDARTTRVLFSGGYDRWLSNPGGNLRDALMTTVARHQGHPRLRSYPAGQLGGEVLCAAALKSASLGVGLGVCGWADRSTLGLVVAIDTSPDRAADLLLRMRADIEHRQG